MILDKFIVPVTTVEVDPFISLKSLTWNIEGLKKNIFNLKYFISLSSPDLLFLSEPNLFSHDLGPLMKHLGDEYSWYLNSEDKFDNEAPFCKNKTFGGTMVLWKQSLDSHISVPTQISTSFLPIIYSPPGSPPSIHCAVYLPTSGQETQFVEQLLELKALIEDLKDKYPEAIVFIRGDSNVNMNNKCRTKVFEHFSSELDLIKIPIDHKTYHHFVGEGLFDSNIDVILQSSKAKYKETLLTVLCRNDYPEVDSSHDIILSTVSIPSGPVLPTQQSLPLAPQVPNIRHRILWSEDRIPEYQSLIKSRLFRIRETWSNPGSDASVSVLLNLTNLALSQSASTTNKHVPLNSKSSLKSPKIPRSVIQSKSKMNSAHKAYRAAVRANNPSLSSVKSTWVAAKKDYRYQCRLQTHKQDMKRDSEIFSLLSSSPTLFKKIKASKSRTTGAVPFLTVGDRTYPEKLVGHGLFASIANLKTRSDERSSSKYHKSMYEDYKHIIKICQNKQDIPRVSFEQSSQILLRMKPSVSDFWSITPLHFINAGHEGITHFNFLMNAVISEINSTSSKELNTVLALLLHKGHGKSLTSDRSYRTISTCPVVTKALDIYFHDLYIDLWNSTQADTQYQGEGSAHELASLLITESIQHSLLSSHKPVFMLFLDAKSAFDTVVIEFLIRNLYLLGMSGHSLLYLANRLKNRVTYCNWKQDLLGPIFDEHGLEQGGVNSSDLYKIYNNDLLKSIQNLKQGVDLGDSHNISVVGQADDIALLSNCIYSLYNILQLVLNFCSCYKIDLCADKTKLLLFSPNHHQIYPLNPIVISDKQIHFTNRAEHVGVVRSPEGNLPHILNRISVHKKQLGALVFTGIAKNHRGNPAASVKLEKLYGVPVLFSGTASLVLSPSEINIIDQHYKNVLCCLLKLHSGTPQAFIYFMSGSLPAKAILHQKQLSLFTMICHLPGDPLHRRAVRCLQASKPCAKSWFTQIRDICLLYHLPHPLHLLLNPPSKSSLKKLFKAHIINYWELKLRGEASLLPSLTYFKPEFHSLVTPHPIYWTAGSNPYEVAKAIIQGKMLSGRYRTELLSRHWSSNVLGVCKGTSCNQVPETLEHILLCCPSYSMIRGQNIQLWLSTQQPQISCLVEHILKASSIELLQFILDASTHPRTIALVQSIGPEILKLIFHLTRSWCFSIHKKRLSLLGRW